jgi:hypothetical protein
VGNAHRNENATSWPARHGPQAGGFKSFARADFQKSVAAGASDIAESSEAARELAQIK